MLSANLHDEGFQASSHSRNSVIETLVATMAPGVKKCYGCKKELASMRFSNNQLLKGSKAQCLSCNPPPPTELECYGCMKVLALNRFSKTQRRHKDRRMCIDCSQERQDLEPDLKDQMEEEKILEAGREKSGQDSVWGGKSGYQSTINSGTQSMRSSRNNDGVYIAKNGPAAGPPTTSSYYAGDDDDETSTQMGPSVTNSYRSGGARSTSTWHDTGAIEHTYANRGQSGAVSDRGAWAKQGAVKKTNEERAHVRLQREKDTKQKATEEEEEMSSDEGSGDEEDFEY